MCLLMNIRTIYCIFLGVNRFIRDIEIMLGKKMIIWWKICWMVISPIAILVSTVRPTVLV